MTTFDHFWSLYPRRVSKRVAVKAWEKEMRSGTDPDEIISGLRRQLPYLRSKEPQFIPHPATWLNQGRWEDEVEQQAAPKQTAYQQHQSACDRELEKIINKGNRHDDRADNVIDIGAADYRYASASRAGR